MNYFNEVIAYFSMEIGLQNDMKTYAGGLGILAGDTLKSASDKRVPMVGITILYKNGYFRQDLDPQSGEQLEFADTWNYSNYLTDTGHKISFEVLGKIVHAKIWEYKQVGLDGHVVPIYFLDTDIDENEQDFRFISSNLYTPYDQTRILQEIMLGAGGVLALKELGYSVKKYHLNESHAAFAVFPLMEEFDSEEKVRSKIVFTTHTPVRHGHRGYTLDIYERHLNNNWKKYLNRDLVSSDGKLLLTDICLSMSSFNNGVARKHMHVSKEMFPSYEIDYITNGIHHLSWISDSMASVFDRYLVDWKAKPSELRNVPKIPDNEIYEAHKENKRKLLNLIKERTGKELHESYLTIGFARRVDAYKRSDFILRDIERLKYIAESYSGLQLIFSGKSFPDNQQTEELIKNIVKYSKEDFKKLQIVYLEDYSMDISRLMVSGCDVWLNNPIRPLEASGTSGMKASLNGVLNFSVVDGWWVEGHLEDITGWSIGDEFGYMDNQEYELDQLYTKLEKVILSKYYYDSKSWITMQKNAIALNASHFNTHRMLDEYISKAYLV